MNTWSRVLKVADHYKKQGCELSTEIQMFQTLSDVDVPSYRIDRFMDRLLSDNFIAVGEKSLGAGYVKNGDSGEFIVVYDRVSDVDIEWMVLKLFRLCCRRIEPMEGKVRFETYGRHSHIEVINSLYGEMG